MTTTTDGPARATVVVTGSSRAPLLTTCFRSIAAASDATAHRVVVVVNAPDDDLKARLAQIDDGTVVEILPVNLGQAAACNRGAGLGEPTSDFVVLVDDDVEVEDGWLDALVAAADAHPEAAVVGSGLLSPDGSVRELGRLVWKDATSTPVTPTDLGTRPESPYPVDCVPGTAMLVRRSFFDAIGGLDEDYYPAHGADVDLCLEAWASGASVLCQPSSRVRHRPGSSRTAMYDDFVSARNRQRLAERWSSSLADRDPPDPHDRRAVQRALERSGTPLVGTPPPRRAGRRRVASKPTAKDEAQALRRELESREAFIVELEWRLLRLGDDMARLAEERAELSSRVADGDALSQTLTAERDSARHQRDDARRQREAEALELLSYRGRLSVRMADRLALALRRVPAARRLARWAMHVVRNARS